VSKPAASKPRDRQPAGQRPAGERITRRFAALAAADKAAFVTFVMAGDPDQESSLALLRGLPAAGADLIELGMAFSDPMADGPAVQAAGLRALRSGASLRRTLALVADFRAADDETPIVLMGYYNPIYRHGVAEFARDAAKAGVDGLIIVDLPPEEEAELRPLAEAAGIAFIRLVAPTTGEARLKSLLAGAMGFVYYIAVTGVTGTRTAPLAEVRAAVARLRKWTSLPIAVGFGIKTPEDAAGIARAADAAVVGSALVQAVGERLDEQGRPREGLVAELLDLVGRLAKAVHGARAGAPS
jgi:tryptophan synthase alpha chain